MDMTMARNHCNSLYHRFIYSIAGCVSQSGTSRRCRSHALIIGVKAIYIFDIGIPPLRIFNSYYRIFSIEPLACIRDAACIWDPVSVRGNMVYIKQILNILRWERGMSIEKIYMGFNPIITPWVWQFLVLVPPRVVCRVYWVVDSWTVVYV